MPKIQSRNKAINPLIELSSTALRLYNALGIFRDVYPSPEDPEWFRAPWLTQRLRRFGLSKKEIDQGVEELMKAELLQMRTEGHRRWYRLR
jgi:hypothetical protein